MKHIIEHIFCLCIFMAVTSCDGNETTVPSQPDFIVVGLTDPYTIEIGEAFQISIPEDGSVETYEWTLPEILSIMDGAGTARLTLVAMGEGTIPAGTISVAAVNSAGKSYSRTLWKDITITPIPPVLNYVKTSIEGSQVIEADTEFLIYVPEDVTGKIASYTWTVPDEYFDIIDGQGTENLTVKAKVRSSNIPANTVSVVILTKTGLETTYHLEKGIFVLPLEGYSVKRYGTKVWMTENLNYGGEDGSLGKIAADDEGGATFGRFYTWSEAMMGSGEENKYLYESSGVDDAGNEYKLNDGKESWNVQVQGICPEGWHIPNAYDYYDLASGIADDYVLRRVSIVTCAEEVAGIFMKDVRETDPLYDMNMVEYGFVSSYLRGSRPESEGGLWKNHSNLKQEGTMFNLANKSGVFPAGEYPLYFPEDNAAIGFNLLPGGRFYVNGNTQKLVYDQKGQYAYLWLAAVNSSNRHYRFNINYNNCNLSTYDEDDNRWLNVRCVANY